MNTVKQSVAILMGLLLAGCASFGPRSMEYKPQCVGSLADGSATESVAVELRPDHPTIHRGQELGFSIAIRNIGRDAIVLPSQPDILLMWVYPNGRRDNFIGDSMPRTASDVVKLEPGQQMVQRSTLKTYYFARAGITEFRAIVSAAGFPDGWTGRVVSNGFGVMVQ
jgi:hypothetical protein